MEANAPTTATYRRIAKVDLKIPDSVSPEARDLIVKVRSFLSFIATFLTTRTAPTTRPYAPSTARQGRCSSLDHKVYQEGLFGWDWTEYDERGGEVVVREAV